MTALADYEYDAAVRGERLVDLSELWGEANLEDKLIPSVRRLIQDAESGRYFMLPVAFIWAGVYYNKAVFAQYQLEPPQTWDEFVQLCATLKANGETPLAMTGTRSYAYTLWFDYLNLRINGAGFHRDLLAGRESYADARVVRVLETWRSLFDQGFVVESPAQWSDTTAISALIRGDEGQLSGEEAVMFLIDTLSIGEMPPPFLAELDYFRFPVLDPAVTPAEPVVVAGYVVPRGAEHAPQAQEFLIYLSSPAAQELLAQQLSIAGANFAPVRLDLDAETFSPEMRKAMAMVQEATELVPFSFQWMSNTLWTGFENGYRRFLEPEHDLQLFIDALEEARARAIDSGALVP
jgi:ABC-type glycerol-3-phosphate transport system substrate-binding protein